MTKVLGAAIIVLALAIGIIPQFTTCASQGDHLTLQSGKTTEMKCLWTARAEIATGVPILMVGVSMIFTRKKEIHRYLGSFGLIMGVLAILLPTTLIGVCSSTMLCNTVMKPTLLTLGSLVITASVIGIALSFKRGE
jgi:hypothetical protein